MTPEQIGKAGEIKLDELCNEISLACASLTPDLIGVDRYLEFSPPEVSGFGSLDTRPAPLSCYVQVKSKGPRQRYWQISLSVAERLAKSSKPAFILLFEVGPDIKVTRGYIAHVRGGLLARVLERLRDAQRRGLFDLNNRTLNLSIRDGVEFKLEGLSFAQALRDAIGDNMAGYAAAKNTELETLGYEEDRLSAHVKFGEIDIETLVDAHLGGHAVPVDEIAFSERRFNIALPAAPGILRGGLMTIEANPMDGYELQIKNRETGENVVLPCSVLYPALPGVPRDAFKFNIEADLITFKFTSSGFTYTAQFDDGVARYVNSWKVHISAIILLHSGACDISLRRLEDELEVSIGTTDCSPEVDIKDIEYLSKLIGFASYLLAISRVADRNITIGAIQKNTKELKLAHSVMSKASGLSPLSFPAMPGLPSDKDSFPILFISAYSIGDEWFAYCARTTMRSGDALADWKGDPLVPVLTEPLQEPVLRSYEAFRNRMTEMTGVGSVCVHNLMDAPDKESAQLNAKESLLENK